MMRLAPAMTAPVLAALALLAAPVLSAPAQAQDLIGGYNAWIGDDDLYNSNGQRLTEPWQVLRQDRANVHRFGISQRGDESDGFFDSANNRAAMERLLARYPVGARARRAILRGGVEVQVRIYGSRGVGDYIEVDLVE